MSDDYQVLSDIVKSKDAEVARLREREAQLEHTILEEQKCTRFFNGKRVVAEARIQELETALRGISMGDLGSQRITVQEFARRALEPRADG